MDEKLLLIKKEAERFLMNEYGLQLSIPIRISKRMKSKLGCFVTKNNQPFEIVLAFNLLDYYNDEVVKDVLKHECVHYALFNLKKPFRDGQAYFENELNRLGISSTYTYKFKGVVQLYSCLECNTVFQKKMKGMEKRYRCGRCGGKLKNIGGKVIE